MVRNPPTGPNARPTAQYSQRLQGERHRCKGQWNRHMGGQGNDHSGSKPNQDSAWNSRGKARQVCCAGRGYGDSLHKDLSR